ncbi:MAG: glycosyltransferase family 39 protein, partial [Amphiplicatus sp.]
MLARRVRGAGAERGTGGIETGADTGGKAEAAALSPLRRSGRWISSVYGVTALFALYAFAHAGAARLAGPVLALDDAKLNVVAQSFQRGYLPANPPLFEWMLILAQHVAGPGALSFALVKASFFAATGAFAYLAARELLSSRRWAALCAFSLLLLFQFGWNYHQAFTHTTALIAATSFFWFALTRLLRTRTMRDYALLGLALGVGLMAKYSFAAAAAAAFAALALQREGRRLLADPRILLSLAVAALLFAPHASWVAMNNAGVAENMAERLTGGGAEPHWLRAAKGVPSALGVMIGFFLPLGLVVAALLRRNMATLACAPSPGLRLARDAALIGAAGLLAAVVLVGMGRMEDRYVIPFLHPAAFALAAALMNAPRESANAKILALCAASFAAFCLGFKLVT